MELKLYYERLDSFSPPQSINIGKFATFLSAFRDMKLSQKQINSVSLKERGDFFRKSTSDKILHLEDFGEEISNRIGVSFDMYVEEELMAVISFGH